MIKFIKSIILSLALVSTTGFADPIGEKASYQLDRARHRTSNMIQKGFFELTVKAFEQGPNGPSYDTDIYYDMTIQYMGREQGNRMFNAPEEFYTAEFIEKLRAQGELHYPQFKARHVGYETITTKDGNTYENCDKVFIWDVDTSSAGALTPIMAAFGLTIEQLKKNGDVSSMANVEDVEADGWYHSSVPVAGMARIDVSGVAEGFGFKAGFDYRR